MEDAAIQALEDKALEYAEIRDQRIALSGQEGELKKELLALMKANKRTHYQHNNILIDIVHEEENVKVKIKAADEEPSHEKPRGKKQAEAALPN